MDYAERIKLSQAKYAALMPPPVVLVDAEIEPEWVTLGIKLAQGKRDYFIPLRNTSITNVTRRPTHILRITQCGANLTTTRHFYTLHPLPENASIVQDALDESPILSGYTPPVIFHSLPDMTAAIKIVIKTQIAN